MIKICVIPGDGIGHEVIPAALRVLEATALPVELCEAEAGWGTFQERGTALPDETLEAARSSDAVLFGAVGSPSFPVPGYRSPIVGLRRALDLYANIRPTSSAGLPESRATGPVDLVVVRENTEGLYAGRERRENDGATAIAERLITRQASERIVRTACDLARRRTVQGVNSSPRVTIVHKANVLRETCGLFRATALEVAAEFPDVAVEELLVDTAAMRLAANPERFDVIVTTNLFGDILSDIACIWGGGLGLASSANLGTRQALFEPVHGSAPDIAGQQRANPLAAIRCLGMLLAWLGDRDPALNVWAQRIANAVTVTLRNGPYTPDLGGSATTGDLTAALIQRL